jgi:tetratricopeptide (TPR) repeat protein
MKITSKEKLQSLVKLHKSNPLDVNIINSVAIGYYENPSSLTDAEDLDYFQLAYNTKRTVKSIHNLAWYYFFEYGEEDKGIELQKECMEFSPKSYLPYSQYGFMLMEAKNYRESARQYEKALEYNPSRVEVHNYGYNLFMLGRYEEAVKMFKASIGIEDVERRSLFALAITEFKLGNLEVVTQIADDLFETIGEVHETIGGYEIGQLFFLLGDFIKSAESAIKQGLDGIDLSEWKELAYCVFKMNKDLFEKSINRSIDSNSKWIHEIESKNNNWSEDDKKERIAELREDNSCLNKLGESFSNVPEADINGMIWMEPLGCLLFDCGRHGNKFDDI